MKEIKTRPLFALFFITLATSVPIQMTNFKCSPNPELCENNICQLRTVRKSLTLLDYHCYHRYPLNSVDARLRILKKSPNGQNTIFIDTHEDICKLLRNDGQSPILLRFFKELQKNGLTVTKCPIKGNVTLVNWPFDVSFLPSSFLMRGNYEVHNFYTDLQRQKSILNSTVFVTINV